MNSTIKLLAILIIVSVWAYKETIGNPYKEYGTSKYWETAKFEDVAAIPDEALEPGNRNGSVLMWAAMYVRDTKIIFDLVERGADVNEPDVVFGGTPLSGAAGNNTHPEIIDALIKHGAEINKVVGSKDKTPLIIAAELNSNSKIIERLIAHSADIKYKDLTGRNALEQAKRFNNTSAVSTLEKYY